MNISDMYQSNIENFDLLAKILINIKQRFKEMKNATYIKGLCLIYYNLLHQICVVRLLYFDIIVPRVRKSTGNFLSA